MDDYYYEFLMRYVLTNQKIDKKAMEELKNLKGKIEYPF